MSLVSVFYMQILSFPSKICWKGCLFSIVCFWLSLSKIRWAYLPGFMSGPSILFHWFSCLFFFFFLVQFLGSFRYIMSFANRDNLSSSFFDWISFISSSYLTALARNSKTMLNESGEIGHPCLVSDFRGNGFIFFPFSMMLAIQLSYITFNMWRYIPSIFVSSWLSSRKVVELCQRLHLRLLRWSCDFCPCFCLYVLLHLWIFIWWIRIKPS
jgi:hypothetical protein